MCGRYQFGLLLRLNCVAQDQRWAMRWSYGRTAAEPLRISARISKAPMCVPPVAGTRSSAGYGVVQWPCRTLHGLKLPPPTNFSSCPDQASPDGCGSHKQCKGILLFRVQQPSLRQLLDLLNALLAVAACAWAHRHGQKHVGMVASASHLRVESRAASHRRQLIETGARMFGALPNNCSIRRCNLRHDA